MDHGPDAHHRLLESGHRAVDVTHAFFTHLHYDHCMDYGRLVLQRWDQGADKIPDLQVYGPAPLVRMTEQLFGVDAVYGPDIRARIEHQSSIDVFRARGLDAPQAPCATGARDQGRRCGHGKWLRIREQIVHEIQREFSGKVVWGEDLLELTFAGPTVANIEGY